jgi:hypothetical protein
MVKAIDHDIASGVGSAGWGAVKGGLTGAVVAAAVGGLAAAGLIGLFAGAAAIAAPLGLAAVAVASVVSFASVGTAATAIGGALGLIKSGSKVRDEKQAFNSRVSQHMGVEQQKMGMAEASGVQQGYQAGFQEGQTAVIQQLQQRAMEMQAQQAAAQPAASHVEKLEKQRAQAAANAVQVG